MSDESWMHDPDPDDLLEFEPVPRKNVMTRGWTVKKQRGFIAALRESGSVRLATAAVGMSYEGVYKLRHAPGGADFARAWDEAVGIGARRVRDVFIDQNIHGIPERVVIGKDVVVERRRFNHRSMIWVLQHHLPELYPGGATTHRRGWGGGGAARWEKPEPPIEEVRAEILKRIEAMERHSMRAIAADPAKRAAWEVLHGPRDWEAEEDAGADSSHPRMLNHDRPQHSPAAPVLPAYRIRQEALMSTNHDTSKLDDLITTTIDSINGFENSAEEAPDGRFTAFFRDMARERRDVVSQLQAHSRSLGGTPTEQGSVAAAIHRRWEDLRAALGGGDKAVIQEVERGEDYLKEEYERAINDSGVSEETRAVISRAYDSVRRGHDRARDMKRELEAAG